MNSANEIYIDFITLRDGILDVSGYLKSDDECEVVGISNGERILPEIYDYPTRRDKSITNFEFKLPVGAKDIKFEIKLSDDVDYVMHFRQFCNMSDFSHYYVKDNKIVFWDGAFNVVNFSFASMISHEFKDMIKIIKKRPKFFSQAILFRAIHLILYPFMKNRKIWIVMDRKTMADDNAEHFFKYAIKQNDNIRKFFAIHNSSGDFKRLSKLFKNRILDCDSFKHRFYYLFTDKLISSQGTEYDLNPFLNRNYPLMAGPCNLDFYFLQHGVIKDNMSSWLRKYDRNPKLIVSSTELEYKSLFDEGYTYGDKVIQLLGLPRYDNLTNEGLKRQIVIMPTWRNYLTTKEELIESDYFKNFNSLINNEKLIDYARSHEYEILFKPHPELTPYLNLFDRNDYVKIDLDTKYQDIFNQSALMVTDYSSIFFDFSYLKKPLIYYQYASDYHYDSENGYFQYRTMGFGPVIDNEDELVDRIIEYIDNGCEMEEVYKSRVDDIFKYHDHDNSKRCYDWIYSH